ncbi:hypothetical protein [Candidatus Methanarcanum hacksteinii]|uniref:hypothetical protein n=1 Tax=Candidatus Methanarcanum hacksteinii TaxID=2911857 RepID=UPI0037DCBDE2
MTETSGKDFTTMAVLGLAYTIIGIGSIFVFLVYVADIAIPELLSFNEDNAYSILLIGIVNIASAIGLLKRVKYMWSASLMFMIVVLAGSIIGLFYIGPMRYILSIFTAFAVLYMFSTNARLWYGVYEETR